MSRDLLKARALALGVCVADFRSAIRSAQMPFWAAKEIERVCDLADELAVAVQIALEKGSVDVD